MLWIQIQIWRQPRGEQKKFKSISIYLIIKIVIMWNKFFYWLNLDPDPELGPNLIRIQGFYFFLSNLNKILEKNYFLYKKNLSDEWWIYVFYYLTPFASM